MEVSESKKAADCLPDAIVPEATSAHASKTDSTDPMNPVSPEVSSDASVAIVQDAPEGTPLQQASDPTESCVCKDNKSQVLSLDIHLPEDLSVEPSSYVEDGTVDEMMVKCMMTAYMGEFSFFATSPRQIFSPSACTFQEAHGCELEHTWADWGDQLEHMVSLLLEETSA